MRLSATDTDLDTAVDAVRARINSLLDRHHGDSDGMELHERQALVDGVARFVMDEDQGAMVDDARLMLLTARALRSIGVRGLAQRMVVCESGLVRAGELAVSGGDGAWLLDLRQIEVGAYGETELAVRAMVRHTASAIVELWGGDDGSGVLGLVGLDTFAERILGEPAPGAMARLAVEIRAWFVDELKRAAELREWRHAPNVIVMDLTHGGGPRRTRG